MSESSNSGVEEEKMDMSQGLEDEQDSDDSEDLEEDSKLVQNYIDVLQRIELNKYVYDDYILLVNIAHDMTDLEKIRQSCELFSAVYPLSPEIWLRWLKTESSIASSEAEVDRVYLLFQRALADYFSFEVALELCKLAPKSSKIEKEIWNTVLSTYALHCTKGKQLFEVWRREFLKKPESPETYNEIAKIYKMQLSIPLEGMEQSYNDFKEFRDTNTEKITFDLKRVDTTYRNTLEILSVMRPFEEKLKSLDPKFHQERFQTYKAYIRECKRDLKDNELQVIYERMVTDCCLNATAWLKYIKFLQYGRREKLKSASVDQEDMGKVFKQTDLDVVDRAIRNCTWSHELYIEKMHILEKRGVPKEEIQKILELATVLGFQTAEPIVAIWLEYLTYLKRTTDFTDEKQKEILRNNFDMAWTNLGRTWGVLADCNCEILQFWGRLEYGVCEDAVKGRELWTTVLESSDNALKCGLWIEFANLELKKGYDAARKIYKKGISTPDLDDPKTLAAAWICFERCFGTLEQLKACQELCQSVLFEYHRQQQKQFNKTKTPFNKKEKNAPPADKKDKKSLKRKPENGDDGTPDAVSKTANRKKPKTEATEQLLKETEQLQQLDAEAKAKEKLERDAVTVFFSNLSFDVTEEDITVGFPELTIKSIDLAKSASGKSRGFAYVEVDNEAGVKKALEMDRKNLLGRPVYISNCERNKGTRVGSHKFKYAEKIEPNKIFVKGLPFNIAKDELEKLFGTQGAIKDIRLVMHRSGTPKGLAYVEYVNEKDAQNAVLKMDQTELRGFTMSIAISDPPAKKAPGPAGPISSLGNAKRLIPGEMKSRMSLIPNVVRKNVLQKLLPPEDDSAKPKSNEDFRKMLLK